MTDVTLATTATVLMCSTPISLLHKILWVLTVSLLILGPMIVILTMIVTLASHSNYVVLCKRLGSHRIGLEIEEVWKAAFDANSSITGVELQQIDHNRKQWRFGN